MIKSDAIKVFFIIFSACILRVFFDFINDIEIHYEEAQYWVWSQNPSLSYLTKGPFIAQAIALSEWIFGHSYLGLKFLSFVSYGGTAIIIGVCSYLISKEKTAFYLGVLFTLSSPAIFALGGIASTDITALLEKEDVVSVVIGNRLQHQELSYWAFKHGLTYKDDSFPRKIDVM